METEKDDVIECIIDDMGVYGEGITHVGGQTVFIPGAIRGERVSAKIVMAKPNLAHAVLTKIYLPSPYRVSPPCPYFKQCGGCSLQHVAYEEQLRLKRDIVTNAFKKYAGITVEAEDTVPSLGYGYRNKLSMPVRFDVKRGSVGGLFMKRSHRVVETESCLLQKQPTFEVARQALAFALKEGLTAYDETNGRGDLRHIAVRMLNGQISLTFVLNGERKRFEAKLKEAAQADGRENAGIFVNINKRRDNVILGEETRLVYGSNRAVLCGMSVENHPQAFFQVNDDIRDRLYRDVIEEIDDGANVVDAYCGAGIMSAMAAKKAKTVVGVEIVAAAVESAQTLKRETKIRNLSFVCGDCADCLKSAVEKLKEDVCVILDPPKSGCQKNVAENLAAAKNVNKIIYVSCNPSTLARDCAIFEKGGFEVVSVRPYDMFPQTTSVETLVVLSKKIPDSHINIDVEFGESEGQFSLKKIKERAEERKPKEKITYKMIQEYIEQTYGFKVHTAYIAEVKRDLGLPMYDAPNAVEELKKPRAHPTPKMVEAIKETLKHFEII